MASGDSTSTGFSRTAIEACLDRITTSRHFSRSRRLCRFLRFSVEETLAGRAEELKERTIGVAVYGRPLTYDSHEDPIVRSEAHRLRARLTAYYGREGAADPIAIDLPKGGYAAALGPNAGVPAGRQATCRLIVPALAEDDAGSAGEGPARAIESALRASLGSRPGLELVEADAALRPARQAAAHLVADYRVEGRLEYGEGRSALTVQLVRLADERPIWSGTERFAARRAGRAERSAAERIATSIGAALLPKSQPPQLAARRSYDLYANGRHDATQYANTYDPRHLEPARRRLDAALEQEPEDAEVLAERARLELLRLYPPRGETARILADARVLLERALAIDPRHARALSLLGHAEGAALRQREALQLAESAVAIDPGDAESRTILAARYASLGFWEAAVVACDWAIALDPVWDASLRVQLYLLTRMGRLGAARAALDDLAHSCASPTEVAIARFDLRLAEGDLAGAEAVLASPESAFPLRPDQEDRRELAQALVEALTGRCQDARTKLDARRADGPRFWDHAIRLALALGEGGLALDWLRASAIHRSYRWLVSEPLTRPFLQDPDWRAFTEELHGRWRSDREEVGPRLPAPPCALPEPEDLLRDGRPVARA